MAYGGSNDRVIDDPERSNSWPQYA